MHSGKKIFWVCCCCCSIHFVFIYLNSNLLPLIDHGHSRITHTDQQLRLLNSRDNVGSDMHLNFPKMWKVGGKCKSVHQRWRKKRGNLTPAKCNEFTVCIGTIQPTCQALEIWQMTFRCRRCTLTIACSNIKLLLLKL